MPTKTTKKRAAEDEEKPTPKVAPKKAKAKTVAARDVVIEACKS